MMPGTVSAPASLQRQEIPVPLAPTLTLNKTHLITHYLTLAYHKVQKHFCEYTLQRGPRGEMSDTRQDVLVSNIT